MANIYPARHIIGNSKELSTIPKSFGNIRVDRDNNNITFDDPGYDSIVIQSGVNYRSPVFISQKGAISGNDSTQALIDAINEGLSQDRPVCIDQGTYIITSERVIVTIPTGKSLTIFGLGNNSVLKRAPGLTNDHKPLLAFTTNGIGHAKSLIISDLFIDSNAINNPIPEGQGSFYFEHCADIRISGKNQNSQIQDILLSNICFDDPVADCVYFPGAAEGNSFIKKATISNMRVLSRSRVRSDITLTGGLSSLNISNCQLQKFEIELNDVYSGGDMVCNLSNVSCAELVDIIGDGKMFFNAVNISAPLYTIRAVNGRISNSIFTVYSGTQHLRFFNRLIFSNCLFRHAVREDGSVQSLSIMASVPNDGFYSLEFKDCRFETEGGEGNVTGNLIAFESAVLVADVDKVRTSFDGCWFDGRIATSLSATRCGSVILKNCNLAGNSSAIYLYGAAPYATRLLIDGCLYDRVTGNFMTHNNVSQTYLTMTNLYLDYARFGRFVNDSSVFVPAELINARVLYSDSNPTGGGYTGDTVKLKTPIPGSPCEWIATVTHPTAAAWKVSKTLGS